MCFADVQYVLWGMCVEKCALVLCCTDLGEINAMMVMLMVMLVMVFVIVMVNDNGDVGDGDDIDNVGDVDASALH